MECTEHGHITWWVSVFAAAGPLYWLGHVIHVILTLRMFYNTRPSIRGRVISPVWLSWLRWRWTWWRTCPSAKPEHSASHLKHGTKEDGNYTSQISHETAKLILYNCLILVTVILKYRRKFHLKSFCWAICSKCVHQPITANLTSLAHDLRLVHNTLLGPR